MENKGKGKHIVRKAVVAILVVILVVIVECCFNTKDYENVKDSKSDTSNATDTQASAQGLELSDYIGMTEDEFLKATGFEKNEYGTYPDMEHAAVLCIDGLVNSLMINQYDAENTFRGYTVGITFDELEGLVSEYNFVDDSEVVGGTRKMYMNHTNDASLAVDIDSQNKVFGIAYVLINYEEIMPDAVATEEPVTDLQNVSAELSMLEENGFDTSILTTEEQVIVSYAKFIAVSSAGEDGEMPVRTMEEITDEIFEYGFASDLYGYNSYGILNYYINCEIYKGLTTTAAEIIDNQYNIGDGWSAMERVDYELDSEHM